MGFHPHLWRKTIAVALRKPGKTDYSDPRAYRLIQLEECLGKVLEAVMARRLSSWIHIYGLVPPTQFGGRPGSSTVDAALTLVNDVEAARNHGFVTSCLTFDIKGYFDFVNHTKLANILRQKNLPVPFVKWVSTFLADREAAICLDGKLSPSNPVSNGIPQGSPISPALSIVYASAIYEEFQRKLSSRTIPLGLPPSKATPTALLGYIDDGNIYTSSISLDLNVAILKDSFYMISHILEGLGLTIDLSKSELIHFSRRHKETRPHIDLSYRGVPYRIDHSDTIKWLGVWFDSKLSFRKHVQSVTTKAHRIATGIQMLANTVRGLHQSRLRLIYNACVRSVMTYASPVWWNGQKLLANKLSVIQNKCLRHICAAFRTTPTRALEIESATPPIPFYLNLIKRNYATRMHKLPRTNPIIMRLPQIWRGYDPPDHAPPLPPNKKPRNPHSRPSKTKSTRLQNIANLSDPYIPHVDIHAIPPWDDFHEKYNNRLSINATAADDTKDRKRLAKEHLELVRNLNTDSRYLLVYTDGSLRIEDGDRKVGSGWVGFFLAREVINGKFNLGGNNEVFDAELMGLARALDEAIMFARSSNVHHIHFFLDNQSAIQAIAGTPPFTSQCVALQIRDSINSFLSRDASNYLHISWIPGHAKISGNERADSLAKEAAAAPPPPDNTITTSYAYERHQSRSLLLEEWTMHWRSTLKANSLFSPADRLPPSLKPRRHFCNSKRAIYGRLIQCRTGHAFLGEYYSSFVPTENPSCPCGEHIQTREHILTSCPAYEPNRDSLRSVSEDLVITDILGTEKGIEALIDFLKETDAFKKARRTDPCQSNLLPSSVPE